MSFRRPLIGILHNFTSASDIAAIVKKIRPDIRLDVVVTGKTGMSSEELESLQSCEVLIVDPNLIVNHNLATRLPKLKWMHSVWAGVDRLTRSFSIPSGPFPEYILTRNGDFYGNQMAEYVLGYIIATERKFFEMRQYQEQRSWHKLRYRTLAELTLGIVGCGDIGREIATIAKSFRMKVWALVKTVPTEEQKSPAVDEYRLSSDLPELLSNSDYVVSLLPSVSTTDGIFDGDILSNCMAKKSCFINIGRGNVVKEETILHALDCGWISRAILDVFSVEPLPEDSPLWTHPLVTVTPHIAGLAVDKHKVAESFIQNYDLFVKGEPLKFMVDWQKGY